MDKLDFLDAPTGDEPAPAPVIEAAPEPTPEPTEGPARGPDGKFAPRTEAAPEPQAEQPAAPEAPAAPQPQQPPPGFVPLAALQEARQQLQAARQAPPPPAPDLYEDPEGYQAHVEQERHRVNLEWSQRWAAEKHGAELTATVMEWAKTRADQDPAFNQRALQNPDPVGFAMQEYQRDQALALFSKPETVQAFLAWQSQTQTPQQPVTITAPAPIPHQQPTPPRSLASAPAAGGIKPGEIPVGPSVAFDSVFKD